MITTQHEPQEFPDLSVAVWEAIHARVAAFEDAWRRTTHSDSAQPRIEDFLSPDDPSGGQLLVELIHSDLHFRLTAGEAVPIEEYLAAYPALAAQPDAVAGLIASEYRFRRRREPEDAASASRRRFPGLAGAVTALLGGDDTLPLDGNGRVQHESDAGNSSTAAVEPLPSATGYELIEEIGRGGMGIVYKAIETRLKRTVALKTLRPGADASERERLRREAEAAAALADPHVVAVYAVFEEGSRLFVASEYVAGGTLADRTNGEPLSPREATALIEPIARAVAHAHAAGIVHRDLKPSNVLLTADGSPKVTDFGLAKREGDDSDLTRTGVIAGSPSYMAPEQTVGTKDVGPAADVWQVGAILYELLTGRPPFRAATALETLDLVRTADPVPPRRLVPRLPRDLETVCLKCLEKVPSNRYASAEVLADDLARFRRGESVQARPVGLAGRTLRWATRHRSQAARAAALIAAVLFGMTSLAIYTTRLARLNDRLGETIQDRDDALAAQSAARQQAVESDRYSRRLLFASDMRLTAEAIREGDLVRAAELLDAHEADATGEYAFVRNALERLVHCPGGEIDHLGGPAYFACLSPDGKTLAACGAPGEIRLYETGTWKPAARWQAGQGELNGLAFHPDGRLLVSAGDDGTVAAWDLDTRTERWRTKVFDTPAYQVVFGLGGSVLAVAGSSPEIVLLDAATAKERQRLPADSGSTDKGSVEALAVAPDGQTLLAATWASGAIAWDLTTGTQRWAQRTVTPAGFPHEHLSVSVSADGRFAAFGRKEPEFLVTDVASGRVIHDGLLPIRTATGDGAWCRSVAFLADSRTLAVANDAGIIHLVAVAEEGLTLAAPRSSWRTGQERISGLVASADGTLLTAARDGTLVAWKPHDEPAWRESPYPGGEKIVWIAPSADRPGSERLFQAGGIAGAGVAEVIDLADRTRHELPGHDQVHWAYVLASADGRRLFASGTTRELYGWDTATHPPSLLFRRGFEDVAPDFRYASLGTATRDGRHAIGSVDRPAGEELFLFDGTSGESLVTRLFPPEVKVQSAISEDGTVVVFTHGTRLLLLDPETLATHRELHGHAEKIIAAALTPDGRRIATADNDREIIVWETVSGRILRRWQAGPGEIRSLAFSRSGGLLVSATDRQPPRLWDLVTGRLLLEPGAISMPTGLLALAPATFTPDGGRLLVAGRENALILDGRRMNRRAVDRPASPARR